MSAFQEKILFGAWLLATSTLSYFATLFTAGETRWLFMTFVSSLLMSGFLAMMFKQPEDTIQQVIGRCGIAILGGIFASPSPTGSSSPPSRPISSTSAASARASAPPSSSPESAS